MPAEGQRGGAGGPTKSSLLIDAINWAIAQNRDETSHYHNKLDTTKIAVSGMSCGGLQALEVAPDPRVTTAIICNSGILGNPGGGMRGMPNLTKDHLAKLHTPVHLHSGRRKGHRLQQRHGRFPPDQSCAGIRRESECRAWRHLRPAAWRRFCQSRDGLVPVAVERRQGAAKMFEGEACGVAKMEGWKVEKKNIP